MHRFLLALAFLVLLAATSAGQHRDAKPESREVKLALADLVRANTEYNKVGYVVPEALDSEFVFASLGSGGARLTPAAVDTLVQEALWSKGYRLSRTNTFTWIDKRSAVAQEVVPVDTAGLESAAADNAVWHHLATRFDWAEETLRPYRSRVGLAYPMQGVAIMGRAADVREVVALVHRLNAQQSQTTVSDVPAGVSDSMAEAALAGMGLGTLVVANRRIIVRATPAQLETISQVLAALGE